MAANEYTPQQAFEVLMNHLRKRDGQLATHIQAVVDAGKDVDETQQVGQRRKRSRSYRRTVPYSYEEASLVALDALQAYFVEQPLFIDSCAKNMAAQKSALHGHFEVAGKLAKATTVRLPLRVWASENELRLNCERKRRSPNPIRRCSSFERLMLLRSRSNETI